MSPAVSSFLIFASLCALPAAHAQEPVPAEPSVEARLERLEARMAGQQALLEQIAARLEVPPAHAALPAAPEVPAAPEALVAPEVPEPPEPPNPPAVVLDFSVEDEQVTDGSVTSFTGPVAVLADQIVEEAVSFGGPVTVSGTVTGDAVSFGADVLVTEQGYVQGDAVSFGGEVRVEPGGRVDGDKVALGSDDAPSSSRGLAHLAAQGSSWMHHMVRRTVLLLCLAGIGVLVLGLFPEKVRNVARGIERHPIRYGLVGLLLMSIGTVVSVLLVFTLVGIPLSGFVLLLLGLAWLLGFVALGQVVGDLLPVPSGARGRAGAFLVGVCLLGALTFVPYLGKLLIFASIFPCVGAAIGTRFGASES